MQRANTFRLRTKAILLLLFWNFAVKFVYILVFKTTVYLWFDGGPAVMVEALIAFVFLFLAPFTSFIADVKFSRFKTLVYSTYAIIISNTIIILGICGFFAVDNFNYLYYIFVTLIGTGSLASLSGMVFFCVILYSLEQTNFEMLLQDFQFYFSMHSTGVTILTTC